MEIRCERRVLDNGLSVLVHEDRTCPIVAVNVWYHVGSKNERPGRTGLAHLFEHLMFEGSAHHDRGYFQPLQAAGALLNGSTNTDRTNYWEVVPTGALELALWLESDRMGYLLPALTDAKFTNQRDVVLNERRQNYENRPYGLAAMATVAALYPSDHPYHWLTIGSADDLRATTLDEVRAFFAQHYHPANASLAIAGAVSPDDAFSAGGAVLRRDRDRARRCTHVNGYAALADGAAAAARGSRRAAAALSRVAFAGDVRAGRRRARSRGRPARQRQDIAAVSSARLRDAAGDRSRGVPAVARGVQLLPGHRDRGARPHARGSRAGGRPRRSPASRAKGPTTVRAGARDRAGRGAVRLPAADGRRLRREERSAQRLQRVSRRARILRARSGPLSRRDARRRSPPRRHATSRRRRASRSASFRAVRARLALADSVPAAVH